MTAMQPILPTKRKRALVSYAEPEERRFEDLFGEAIHGDDSDDYYELPDNDTEYGSRKKPNKRKPRPQKRTRFIISKQSEPKKPFRFLELPPELRDYIYELALVEPTGLTLISKFKSFRWIVRRGLVYNPGFTSNRFRFENLISERSQWNYLAPQLLAVSKQIHMEAVGHLYKQKLILENTLALHTFLATIGQSNRILLSDVAVKDWGRSRGTHRTMNRAALTSLAACVNLQKLHLDCQIGHLRTPKQLARQIYRDGHFFMEAIGAATSKKDAAIDVLELNDHNFSNRYPGWPSRNIESWPDRETFKSDFQSELRKLLLG